MNEEEIKNLEIANNIIEETLLKREDKIIHISDFKERKLSDPFPTGFKKLDNCVLGGFRGGDLILLSGLSKHGKSQVSLQMTKAFSVQAIPVLWFTFEMPILTLKWRFDQMKQWNYRRREENDEKDWNGLGWVFETDQKKYFDEMDLLCYMPEKNVSDKVEWLKERIIDAYKKFDIRIVIVDNLDFLTIDQRQGDDKLTMQKRIVGMLKKIALDLDIVVVLNAHVNKLSQGQKRPRMENVYGASETYKLADLIFFVFRKQEQPVQESESSSRVDVFANEAEIIVVGNRLTGINRVINLDFKDNIFVEI